MVQGLVFLKGCRHFLYLISSRFITLSFRNYFTLCKIVLVSYAFEEKLGIFFLSPQFYVIKRSFYVKNNGLFILPVKFTQNWQNKQRHFYSTGKIACRLSKSIVGWNIHMTRSQNQKILSRLCAQREGVIAVQVIQ